MDPLVLRIKELDQITFQQLCFQLMSERFPSAKVRYPEGAAGDDGIDLFQGDLDLNPTVWQCKAFQVTLIGGSQKQQIRESLRKAFKAVRPKIWILCLNMNLDIKGSRWFSRLQISYKKKGITIADPFEALDVARELMFRRTLRDYYFPGLTIDASSIKSLVKAAARGTDFIDDLSLENLMTEDAEEYLDRLRDKDPRFVYEVTFGGERGPSIFPPPNEPGLISAMTDGRRTVKAFARDCAALKFDSLSLQIGFSGGAEQKLLNFISTGHEQFWGADEISAFKSTVPLLTAAQFVPGKFSLRVSSIPDDEIIALRLNFVSANSKTSMEYVEFKKVRLGRDEVEIKMVSQLPLELSLILPTSPERFGGASVSTHMAGNSITKIMAAIEALRLLNGGCSLEVHSVKFDTQLCTLQIEPLTLSLKEEFFEFIQDLDKIATKFKSNFILPDVASFTRDDERTFQLLRAITLKEPLDLENISMELMKSADNIDLVEEQLRNKMTFRIEHESATAKLFNAEINLGPTIIQIDCGEIVGIEETRKNFRLAKVGSAVPISLRPLTPVHFLSVDRASLLS